MREDALNGEPIAKERYDKTLAMRREAYHAKKSEQTAWQYAYIVLAKEIWYCIDSLTNRDLKGEVKCHT